MGQQTIRTLKDKFAEGKTPTGGDFGDVFDSYLHKSTKINQLQVLGLNEDFATKRDLQNISIGMIYKVPVSYIGDLLITYPDAEKGWACIVENEKDENGNSYIYQFDGNQWNNTGLTLFPDSIGYLLEIISTSDSNNLLTILDHIGNVLFRVDSEGKMHVRLADDTVNYEALSVEVRNVLNGLQLVVSTSDNEKYISVLLDAENRIIEGVQKDGVRYIEKLKVGQFVDTELNTPDTGSISKRKKHR